MLYENGNRLIEIEYISDDNVRLEEILTGIIRTGHDNV